MSRRNRVATAAGLLFLAAGGAAYATPLRSDPVPRPPLDESIDDELGLWTADSALRGANLYQDTVEPENEPTEGPGPVGPPYTLDDFQALADAGANLVQLSHPGLFTVEPPYELDGAVQENLDRLIRYAERADLFVAIAFRTGPGRSESAIIGDENDGSALEESIWTDAAAQDAWVDMMRYTAQRYADNEVVVGYDPMVEPNSTDVFAGGDIKAFQAKYGGQLPDWNQLAARITAAVREVDGKTPLLIGGNQYSAVAALPYLEPTGDDRTVYTVHHYDPFGYTHQEDGPEQGNAYPGYELDPAAGEGEGTLKRRYLEAKADKIAAFADKHGVPVAVTEFGVTRWNAGAARFLADQMDVFSDHGFSWALWEWDTSFEPTLQNYNAFDYKAGPDPDQVERVDNKLLAAIEARWAGDSARPSNVGFGG